MFRSHSLKPSCKTVTIAARSTQGSKLHVSSKAYNPYRPDPPELPKEPRRVVMKNLKFGRLAQAASAGVEGARRSLVETTAQDTATATAANSFHSSSRSSTATSARASSHRLHSTLGDSSKASYRNGRSLPTTPLILLAVVAVGGTVAYSNWSKGAIANQAGVDLSTVEAVSSVLLCRACD